MTRVLAASLTCPRCKAKVQAPSNLPTLNCVTQGCGFKGKNPHYAEQWIAEPSRSVPQSAPTAKAILIAGAVVGGLAILSGLVWLSMWLSGDELGADASAGKASTGYDLLITNRASSTLWVRCWNDNQTVANYIQVRPDGTVELRLDDQGWTDSNRAWHLCQSSTQQVFTTSDDAILDGLQLLVSRPSATEARCTEDTLADCRVVYIEFDGELTTP